MDQNDNSLQPLTVISEPFGVAPYIMDEPQKIQAQVDALTYELLCTLKEMGL